MEHLLDAATHAPDQAPSLGPALGMARQMQSETQGWPLGFDQGGDHRTPLQQAVGDRPEKRAAASQHDAPARQHTLELGQALAAAGGHDARQGPAGKGHAAIMGAAGGDHLAAANLERAIKVDAVEAKAGIGSEQLGAGHEPRPGRAGGRDRASPSHGLA